MYAIFEEVIGHAKHSAPLEEDQGIELQPIHYDKSKRSYNSQRIYTPYAARYSTHSLPRGRRRLSSSSEEYEDNESVSSSNPLLDTISVLTYDPPDDSDDDYLDCRRAKSKKSSSQRSLEGDRDSIGYAGSNSIDSGYKSFCPTPDIPDLSFYGENRTASLGRSAKPKIMMGTKVISRHVSPLREGSRKSDSSLYDVNLDHLMYLRQSLLSAIQKCESTNKPKDQNRLSYPVIDNGKFPEIDRTLLGVKNQDCTKTLRHLDSNVVQSNVVTEDQCCSKTSRHMDKNLIAKDQNCTKTTAPLDKNLETKDQVYTKSVRFDTDVKITKTSCSRTSETQNRTQYKSILKDPLCANLRSQLESGGDCTLEEEIDSLLYDRAEFYDLESVDEFPCSYVTMIEEKYKSGKSSIAKVRKLKGINPVEGSPKTVPQQTSESASVQSTASETVSMNKTAKCRFTEVARCMLEIIEDLQIKKLQPDHQQTDKKGSTTEKPEEKIPESTDPMNIDFKPNDACYNSAAEYHVYEEIDYDFLELPVRVDPPPLPARPSVTPLLPKNHLEKTSSIEADVRNRGNLYCLFSDRLERMNISKSLEREWQRNGISNDNHEDDYGFRKESSSI